MIRYFSKVIHWLSIYKYRLIIFTFILFCFLVNTLHTQFPDEFDNIFGGYLINQGNLPYVGFFTHHNPGAYFLASIITPFTQKSFVLFRLVFALLLFSWYLISFKLLEVKLGTKKIKFFLFYGIFVAVGATYWWGQMLLSETIVGNLLVPVVLLIVGKKLYNLKFGKSDLWIISVLSFFSLFVSLSYIYFIPFILIISFYLFWKDNHHTKRATYLYPIIVFSLPYGVFLLYLFLTGSLAEFYFASIFYNVKYYIYNFPMVAGQYSQHPIRYAISIARGSIDSISVLLRQLPSLNFSYPLNLALALGNVAFLIYLVLKRQFLLAILIASMVLYTNSRSDPLNIKETDFHATVYIMVTIATTMFLLFELADEINQKIQNFNRLIYSALLLLAGTYWFFTGIFLGNTFMNKAYAKLMGNEPLIYDRSQTEQILNKLLTKDDYYWIGPFELQELLFLNGKPASKYFWFLPASSRDEKIKTEIIADFERTKPKIILFKKWWANFGVKPEEFNSTIVNYLDKNYFQIEDLKKEGLKFTVNMPNERDFKFEDELYFRNESKEKIIKELFEKNLIKKII